MQRYLKAGLDKSFVDYPLPALPFMRRKATPFDLNMDEAVEFLESRIWRNAVDKSMLKVSESVGQGDCRSGTGRGRKATLLEMIMAAVLDRRACPAGGLSRPGQNPDCTQLCDCTWTGIQTDPVHPGPPAGRYHRRIIFNRDKNRFELRKGPIFANIILADEINRASPKTQSALLEAMQEGQVTLDGETEHLPEPFLVLATQNPIEYEGTFPLPEAQLDRFMIKLKVGYPNVKEEAEILRRRRERQQEEVELHQVTNAKQVLELAQLVETVHIDADLEEYIASHRL